MLGNEKFLQLYNYLKNLDRVMVAFSGGVDSTFLLKAAKDALGKKVKAVTIRAPYIQSWEIEEALQTSKELGIAHEIIEAPIIDEIRNNPANRCYLCKKAIFSMIKSIAERQQFPFVIDGSNYDDTREYRPGLKALEELRIKSPLMDCQLTKREIRDLSKELGLVTWDKPSYACLLTRIPYNSELKVEDFIKIEKAEKYMMDIGFRSVRVRCHEKLARIEVDRKAINKILNEDLLQEISIKLKEYGFKYVTLDLDGYRAGSFNEKDWKM
ncbi:ATP-dependent sacrificial sulfur transferase LarE [Desulforamulus aquiferis]|uniref:ATP-dependent sacrificial sulfur transferase LarE n=1 Tax=Desulforamulus aquiferis TaxID=1397668 RepID=A0AAW7ZFP4_9FIRM|nr:ATP-dependent sacrificial sulfur transferase LarE [Desulforamulus aquiferis]MDO7787851.1 ATP-dependent sacrificial sulfur transferase LarE [Desulforamulus aquiferis]